MSSFKIVARGVDTLVLNVCYADDHCKPVKQELSADLQAELSHLQEEARTTEVAVATPWAFKGFHLYIQPWAMALDTHLSSGDSGGLTWAVW